MMTMAPTTITSSPLLYRFPNPNWLPVRSFFRNERNSARNVDLFGIHQPLSNGLSLMSQFGKQVVNPISAVGSGFEASIADTTITLRNAKVVEESRNEDKIQLRVDLTGDETQRIFSKVLTNLARTAPPIPGFRREKGGKTTKVPQDFLLQILGEERVTNFVIQEMVSSTLADYAKKENLKVKDNKVTTTQKAEELRKLFAPGNEFGFNAVLELDKTETAASSKED